MTRIKPSCTRVSWPAALGVAVALSLTAAAASGRQAPRAWPPADPLTIAPDTALGTLPPSVTASVVRPGRWRCVFRTHAPGAHHVALTGTFNGWNKAATPMSGPDPDGWWTTDIGLDAGKHQYKFVVDHDQWRPDPLNEDSEHDGHDGRNSILRLGRVASLTHSDATVGDGRIEALALMHDPDTPMYLQRLPDQHVLLRYRTLAHDVERVEVVFAAGDPPTPLTLVHDNDLYAVWEALVALPDAPGDALEYTFVLTDGSLRASDPQTYGVPVSADVFRTPEWAKHAIWYQIFPERFRNGDPTNDPDPVVPWTMDWFSAAPWEGRDGQSFYKFYVFQRFYGGDLAGIAAQLPYLRDLGVNAIYLNPVFKAASNHKYEATNYLHIDDHFGVKGDYEAVAATEDLNDPSTWKWTESDQLFLDFLRQAHAMGIRVIIDGVFNHVGRPHPAFQDVLKHGQNSPYADWFNVTSWDPFQYTGWAGFGDLPEFKKSPTGLASESAKQHIFNVTRRWMDPNGDGDPSDGIDGWRLDVPNEIPAPFWVEWRDLVKSVNPDAYITGEIWDRADLWLDGRHFDAVMNYEFARPTFAWMFNKRHKISPSEIDQRFRELRLAYPREATYVLQNLMNSHDTDRVASMAHNPDRSYDHGNRVQDNGPDYDNAKPSPTEYRRARLAALLQMTYVGAPMVYYGDEVGMWGADDPTCRKPMLWKDLEPYEKPEVNHVMSDHLAYYKEIIALRNAHPALRTGSFRTLLVDDPADVWAFLRANEHEQLIVVLNASSHEREVQVPLPADAPETWQPLLNARGALQAVRGLLTVRVPAIAGVVLHANLE